VSLATLEGADDEHDRRVGADPPGPAHLVAGPRGNVGERGDVDPARHDPDALGVDARPQQRRANALGDRDDAIDGAIVQQAGVGTTARHIVHPSRDDPPNRTRQPRRQRVCARGVEVNQVVPGDEPTEAEGRAHVGVIGDP
jgi:hypothetical protein